MRLTGPRLLLLVCALLLTQLGGLLHGLSHKAQDKERPHAACQLCAAYASFDHAVAGKSPPPPVQASLAPFALPAAAGMGRVSSLPYRARAPPLPV